MKIVMVELYEVEFGKNFHYILECVSIDSDSIFEGYKFYSSDIYHILREATNFDSRSPLYDSGRYSKSIHRNDTKLLCKYDSPSKFVKCIQSDYPELFI